MNKTYFDSDGVIFDFYGWVKTKNPLANLNKSSDIDHTLFDNYLEGFRDFPVIKGRESLIDRVIIDENSFILTAVPSFKRWKEIFGSKFSDEDIKNRLEVLRDNKIKWYKDFGVPEGKVIICEGTSAKMSWCSPGDVLFDDFEKSVDKWNDLGGLGVLVSR